MVKKKDAVKDRFCSEYGITRKQLKVLAKKVETAALAQTDASNQIDLKYADKMCEQVDEYAKAIGFTFVQWADGIYPRFFKGEMNGILPE